MRVKLTIEKAKGLRAADTNGLSDPFVKFEYRGTNYKTQIKKKTLDPVWSETFLIDYMPGSDERNLKLQIMDWDRFTSDDPLGEVIIDLSLLSVGSPPINKAFPVVNGGSGQLFLRIEILEGGDSAQISRDIQQVVHVPGGHQGQQGQQTNWQGQQQTNWQGHQGQQQPNWQGQQPNWQGQQPQWPGQQPNWPGQQSNWQRQQGQQQQWPGQLPPQWGGPPGGGFYTPGSAYTGPGVQPAPAPPPHFTNEWSEPVKALQQVLPHVSVELIKQALDKFHGDREQALAWLLDQELDVAISQSPTQLSQSQAQWQSQQTTFHYGGYVAPPQQVVDLTSTFADYSSSPAASAAVQHTGPGVVPASVETDNTIVMQGEGRKKALLVGINYFGTSSELRGCINDVRKMKKALIGLYGFSDDPAAVVCLTDDATDSRFRPSRKNIIYGMKWLIKDAQPGDIFFFHYSGHGTQVPNTDGTEDDGMDEVILPEDFKENGVIKDDEIHACLVEPLPANCRLTAVMDCCHSGTGMDLPFVWTGKQWEEEYCPFLSQGDVQLFSGCMDNQTSADMAGGGTSPLAGLFGFSSSGGGNAGGAMTTAFLSAVTANPYGHSYPTLLEHIRKALRARGLSQVPQLSSSQKFPLDRPFNLVDIIPNHNAQFGRVGTPNRAAKARAKMNRFKNMLNLEGNGQEVLGMVAGALLNHFLG